MRPRVNREQRAEGLRFVALGHASVGEQRDQVLRERRVVSAMHRHGNGEALRQEGEPRALEGSRVRARRRRDPQPSAAPSPTITSYGARARWEATTASMGSTRSGSTSLATSTTGSDTRVGSDAAGNGGGTGGASTGTGVQPSSATRIQLQDVTFMPWYAEP